MSERIEFVPPGDWRTVAFKRSGRFVAGLFYNPSHWAFGIELWTATFSILFGPLCLAFAPVRKLEQPNDPRH